MRFHGNHRIALFTCLVIALSIYVPLYRIEFQDGTYSPVNRTGEVRFSDPSPFDEDFMFTSTAEDTDQSYSLHYDYYRDSCPSAERIIGKSIRDLYGSRPSVAPNLIRLLFHDCFIEVRSSTFPFSSSILDKIWVIF